MTAVALGVLAAVATAGAAGTMRLPSPSARHRSAGRLSRPLRLAVVTTAALGSAVIAPPLPLLVGTAWWLRRRQGRQRTARHQARDLRRALPQAVDLLLLTNSAGIALPVAHGLVAPWALAPLGPALAAADAAAGLGRPRAEAIVAELTPLGDRARALAEALGDHLRYGVALGPALERAALELRLDRRRQAEQDARRVPVRLLAPLVSCILPAFALLTVVPLLAASLQALPT